MHPGATPPEDWWVKVESLQRDPRILELGSDPGIGKYREGTIQPTTAAKVWQNQKYEEFITAREKTAREDL